MQDHLEAGRVLLIDMHSGRSRHTVNPSIDGIGLRMSTGPMTLAHITGAILIPCLITAEPYFRFSVHFGEPIEAPDRTDIAAVEDCAQRILSHYLPILADHPEEITFALLRNLTQDHA